ncbi:MAG: thiamine diphosphokinase [Bacillota bacterium]
MSSDNCQAVVVLNGNFNSSDQFYKDIIIKSDILLAADGGARLYKDLGINPGYIIGDFDSLSETELDFWKKRKVTLEKYPVDKDKTDGELAIDYSHKLDCNKIIILGGLGGRFDQQLANIYLLEYSLNLGIEAFIKEENLEIGIIEESKEISGYKDWNLSLLPLDKNVRNISISGTKYDIEGLDLLRSYTRGISNRVVEDIFKITVGEGRLIYILYDDNTD